MIVRDAGKPRGPAPATKPKDVPVEETPPIFTHPETPPEPAPAGRSTAASDNAKASGDAVMMPKMEITAKRSDELNRELQENERASAWEEDLTKPSELDQLLNGSFHIPLFGGGSSAGSRAAQAQWRVGMLETERRLILAIAASKSDEEKKDLRKFLEELRSMRRGTPYGETFHAGK